MTARKKKPESAAPAPKAPSELTPDERKNYEDAVANEVMNLLETRGCTMIVTPAFRTSASGAFEVVTQAEIKVKREVVIKKEL